MNDDKIKDLFAGFDPQLSDTDDFMARVTHGLDAIGIVRQQQAEMMRRQRRAIRVSAAVGVLIGVGLTMLYMLVADGVSAVYLPDVTFIVRCFGLKTMDGAMVLDLRIPMLMAFAAVATLAAINAYTLLSSTSVTQHGKVPRGSARSHRR